MEILFCEVTLRTRCKADTYRPAVNRSNMSPTLQTKESCTGRYVSALHRVRNTTSQDRISMPLFLDPGFDAMLEPIAAVSARDAANVGSAARRWDGTDLATLSGTYGDYLLGKVAKVFPELGRRHLR